MPCNCPRTVLGVRLVIIGHECEDTPRTEYAELKAA